MPAWAVVSRADILHLWFPGIDACEVEGDQRTIHLGTGMAMVETILTNDPTQRRFQYSVVGGFFTEHLGSIDVVELAEERCLVVYTSDVRPAVMSLILGGATHGALRELRRQLEAGEGPALDALTEPRRGGLMGRKILFVTTDQQRYDTLGCNGGHPRPDPGRRRARRRRASATSGPSRSRWSACRRARRCSPASTRAPTACG